jgi:hypothetical protein
MFVVSISIRRVFYRSGGRMPLDNLGRAYEWFLDLPELIVLAVLWVVGLVLEGLGVVALYRGGLVLARLEGADL